MICFEEKNMKIKVLFFMFSLQEGGAQRTVVNIINNLDKNKFEILLVLGTTKNNVYLDYIDTSLIKVIYLNMCTVI
jgi:hypothetical protein